MGNMIMKLKDLDPRWFTSNESNGEIVGLTFDCPHCRVKRLGVLFHADGHPAIKSTEPSTILGNSKTIWTLTGTSFNDLSLTPSIDASKTGHWHGHIKNGEIC